MRAALLASVVAACGYPPLDLSIDAQPRLDGHDDSHDAHGTDAAKPDAVGPPACPIHVAYTGPVVPIPDNLPGGTTIPLDVPALGTLTQLVFRLDGAACTTDAGATTVGIDHTFVGDLTMTLTSPAGTLVTLIAQVGLTGHNFCQTVLDDNASLLIENVSGADAPFTGTFLPDEALAKFAGETTAGTWLLNVSDGAATDTGSVRAFSIDVTASGCK